MATEHTWFLQFALPRRRPWRERTVGATPFIFPSGVAASSYRDCIRFLQGTGEEIRASCGRGACICFTMNADSACVCIVGMLVVCQLVGAYPNEGGLTCSADRDCLFSMRCSNNKCVCKEGYYTYKGNCLGGIGSICQYDEDCIVDSYCKNLRSCECVGGLKESEDGSKCIGDVTTLGRIMDSSCQENYDCELFGPAFCELKTNLCQCRVYGHLRNGRCWNSRGLGEQCFESEECYSLQNPDLMECHKTNHTCVCKTGTHLAKDGITCEGAPGRASINLTSLAALLLSYLLAKILSS